MQKLGTLLQPELAEFTLKRHPFTAVHLKVRAKQISLDIYQPHD